MKKILFYLITLMGLIGCSNDGTGSENNGYTEEKAQQVYNQLKGTYVSHILIEEQSMPVNIIIDDNFTVKQLPLQPILKRIFTEKKVLDEVLEIQSTIDFVTKPDVISINTAQVLLSMKQGDLIFYVKSSGTEHRIIATILSLAYKAISFEGLVVEMNVSELNYDGRTIDLSNEPISYLIDSAQKQSTTN